MNGRGRVDVGRYTNGRGILRKENFEEGERVGIEGLVGRGKG